MLENLRGARCSVLGFENDSFQGNFFSISIAPSMALDVICLLFFFPPPPLHFSELLFRGEAAR